MPLDTSFSTVEMIRDGIAGKDKAIAAYDEMLWKVRAGFASVLYGSATLIVSLVDKSKLAVSLGAGAYVAILLISGFTIAACSLDFSLLRSKLRVVESKEELVDLALLLTSSSDLDQWRGTPLNVLLHNSGEGRAPIHWEKHPVPWAIATLYLGSWLPLVIASRIIAA